MDRSVGTTTALADDKSYPVDPSLALLGKIACSDKHFTSVVPKEDGSLPLRLILCQTTKAINLARHSSKNLVPKVDHKPPQQKELMSISFEFDDSGERKKRAAMTQAEANTYSSLTFNWSFSRGPRDKASREAAIEAYYRMGLWHQYDHVLMDQRLAFGYYERAIIIGDHVQSAINFCSLPRTSAGAKVIYLRKVLKRPSISRANVDTKIVVYRELGKILCARKTRGALAEGRDHLLKAIELGDQSSAKWHMGLSYLDDPRNKSNSIDSWNQALYWFECCSTLSIPDLINLCYSKDLPAAASAYSSVLTRTLRLMDRLRGDDAKGIDSTDRYLNGLWEIQFYTFTISPRDLLLIRKEIVEVTPFDQMLSCKENLPTFLVCNEELHQTKELIAGSQLLSPDLMNAAARYLPWYDGLQPVSK
jgi:hypothetical protein